MPNLISSIAFCYSNGEKTENGHIGRLPVMIGQARNAVVSIRDTIFSLDNSFSKSAQSASEAFERLAENNKIIDYTGKAVGFISKHVNKFIIGSSVIDVALSKDKKTTAVETGIGLTSMFATENFLKKHFSEEKIANELIKSFKGSSKGKIGAIANITYGVVFTTGSIFSYYLGGKFGDILLGKSKDK